MNRFSVVVFAVACALSPMSQADDDVAEAAIGGALGGVAGAAIGAEMGGTQGAIIGAGIGGAAGAAIGAHDDNDHNGKHRHATSKEVVVAPAHHGHFCPPGQAKKGNC